MPRTRNNRPGGRRVRGNSPPRGAHPSRPAPATPSTRLLQVPGTAAPSKKRQKPGTLPAPPTPIIGRERELEAARELLLRGEVRLLTFTGAPGIGKTRLALEVATDLQGEFRHGVVFIDLTPVGDPALVVYELARALGVPESPSIGLSPQGALERQIQTFLRRKHLLLFVDNFERVVVAGPQLADLLAFCPAVKILATSREPLHVRWEYELPVDPLAVPDIKRLPAVPELVRYPAVALFVERTRAFKPDFSLTAENAGAIAEICVHLDGLPLAIELATTHLKVLSVRELRQRLQHRLDLLAGGPRDLPTRQQTLRTAIAWSYDLLTSQHQALFRRMAVFSGGCNLEAVRGVCSEEGSDAGILGVVTALIDKNLLLHGVRQDRKARFRMLESLREFGLEQLAARGELDQVRARHAGYFLALAERAEPECWGPDQADWLERLNQDHDNFRVALQWSLERGAAGTALRLAGTLGRFWNVRCHWSEGLAWLERALRESPDAPAACRAKALYCGGVLAGAQYDTAKAEAMLHESLALSRELGDLLGTADAFWHLGYIAHLRRDHQRVETLIERSLSLSTKVGDKRRMAAAKATWAKSAFNQGRTRVAARLAQESLSLSRNSGDKRLSADMLRILGYIALVEGDFARALTTLEESLTLFREVGDRRGVADDLHTLGWVAVRRGEYGRAVDLLEESLIMCQELHFRHDLVEALEGAVDVAIKHGEMEKATVLLGAAEAGREVIDFVPAPYFRAENERRLMALRSALGDDRAARLRADGRAFSLDQATEQALQVLQDARAILAGWRQVPREAGVRLSPREREVAALVAKGLSNREIAAALFISERTVEFHVQNILNKLGFHSRARVVSWAVEHGLHAPPPGSRG